MKRVVLLLTLAIFGVAWGVSAQTDLPSSCSAFYPDVLAKKAVIELSDARVIAEGSRYGQTPKPKNPKHWVVYSDRENNTTYTRPGGGEKFSSLDFNEQVRIAKIENGYALVYTEPNQGMDGLKISSDAKSRGWVSMSKLLLWHSCPADSHGIYQKALICANLDQANRGMGGQLYKNPNNTGKAESLSTDMRFYYVMKSEGDLSLLATMHTLDGRSSKVLYGWVSKQSYVPWNQRSCLEPTWDKEAVEYFAKNDIKIGFYDTKKIESTKAVAVSGFVVKPEPARYDKHLYRMPGRELRYPILDGSTSKLYNISTFTKLNAGTYDISAQSDSKAEAAEYSEHITEEMTHINIGLVIDGTTSMGEFYPAVIEAIKKSCKEVFSSHYKIKVGAVIYRDYADGEKYSADVFKLTSPNNQEFYKWLETGGGYGIKSASSDRTFEEALYHGVNTAIDKLEFNSKQSNILLVVGDCGNARNDTRIKREDIINKLVKKNIHLMGFQVRNSTSQAFGDFNSQVAYLIKASLEKKYAKLAEKMSSSVAVTMNKTNDGYELANDHNSIIYIGSHSFPSSTPTLAPEKLSKLITTTVGRYAASVQRGIDLVSSHATVGFANSNLSANIPEVDKAFVRNLVGDAYYEDLNRSNALITFSGYALKQQADRDMFKPVIFISSDELTALLAKLDPVNDAAAVENPNNREPYVNAMMALASTLTGDAEEIASMGHKEIMRKIQGLNEATDALKGYTIQQIASPQSVNTQTYLALLSDFRTKYRALRKIKDSQYKYTVEMNGIRYYWIPAEDMP